MYDVEMAFTPRNRLENHRVLDAYCPKVVVRVTPPRARAHESFMSMLMKLS